MSNTTSANPAPMATAEELGLRLLEQALDVVTQQIPVEDIHDRLDTGDDNETLMELLIVLEDHLQTIFEPHGPACGAIRPQTVLAVIRPVVCTGCIPPADLRQVIRFARKPTRYQRSQFRADPAHWARVIALVAATVLAGAEDPHHTLDMLAQAVLRANSMAGASSA